MSRKPKLSVYFLACVAAICCVSQAAAGEVIIDYNAAVGDIPSSVFSNSGGGALIIEDGEPAWELGGGASQGYFYEAGLFGLNPALNSDGFVVRARMKYAGGTNTIPRTALWLRVGGRVFDILWHQSDNGLHILLGGPSCCLPLNIANFDATDGFHDYDFVFNPNINSANGGTFQIYIDGTLRLTLAGDDFTAASTDDLFGVAGTQNGGGGTDHSFWSRLSLEVLTVCPCDLFTMSEFKSPMGKKKRVGATLPVKFDLFYDGSRVESQSQLNAILTENNCETACPEIDIVDVTDLANEVEIVLPEDLANTGEGGDAGFCFRFSDGNWIYNLDLDPSVFSSGRTYMVKVYIGDCAFVLGNNLFQTK